MNKLWLYNPDDRYNISGLFICSEEEIDSNVGKSTYYYGTEGKYSEIYGEIEKEDFTLISDNPTLLLELEKFGPIILGLCPFDYISHNEDDEEEHE